jgi:hypothetical protein
MNIRRFSVSELFSNSQGKSSISLVCVFMLVTTGCIMGIKGAFDRQGDSMLQGIAFATLGTGLLAVRRYTPDKEIPDKADGEEK